MVKYDFYGDGYLPLQGRTSKRRRSFTLIFSRHIRTFFDGNPRFPRNASPKQKNNGQSIDYPLFLVEATGLEPTTFWSLWHNRKFFIYFPSISKSFVSATNTFLYSCSHCFHVVQIRKWSNMWSPRLHAKNGCEKLKTTYPCTYSFVCS